MNYICRNITRYNEKSFTPIKQCELCGEYEADCKMHYLDLIGWICECCLEDYVL